MEDLISEALEQTATEPVVVTPEQLSVDAYRMTSQTQVAPKEYLFRLFGKPCFPRKDVTAITGPAKSGKTFFTSMLLACGGSSGRTLERIPVLERIREEPLKVLWYDTEQSQDTTKEILIDRIGRMMGHSGDAAVTSAEEPFPDERFFVFNVRRASIQERSNMLGVAIATYQPDLVVVDGISDLIPDINDGPKATELMQRLMMMADAYQCNISVIIHLNRSGEKNNLRGWLGSVIMNKCFEVFNCAPVTQTEKLSVELSTSRKYRNPQALFYEIDENGIPYTRQNSDMQQNDGQGRHVSSAPTPPRQGTVSNETLNRKYIINHPDDPENPWEWDLRRLFTDAMGGLPSMGLEQMKDAVMRLSHIQQEPYYDKLLEMAEKNGIVVKTYDRYKRVVLLLRPPR